MRFFRRIHTIEYKIIIKNTYLKISYYIGIVALNIAKLAEKSVACIIDTVSYNEQPINIIHPWTHKQITVEV
jgi:hypothetical protein